MNFKEFEDILSRSNDDVDRVAPDTYRDALRFAHEKMVKYRKALEEISFSNCPMQENEWGYRSESPDCHLIADEALEEKE